ncbi:class I SAM-dependent methyltransferase [Streptomyces sp. NPDC006632]|uniref:class I SAM-dependent methyltransferase n=1 Tax=Streptomyces sp. NPDC006632 TaxID=3157182 RepID=UPI0033A2B244
MAKDALGSGRRLAAEVRPRFESVNQPSPLTHDLKGNPNVQISTQPTALDWDRWYEEGRNTRIVTEIESQNFRTRVGAAEGMTVLDVACGTGGWTRQLARWGMNVTGLDFSAFAIGAARRGGSANGLIRYEQHDVDAAGSPDWMEPGSVDIVSVRCGIAFLDRPLFLRVAGRLLRPSTGALYVMTLISEDEQQHAHMRGLSENEVAELGYGWASCAAYSLGPYRCVVLRGPAN